MTLTARLHRMSKSKICITTYVNHILNYAQCLIVERKQLKQDLDFKCLFEKAENSSFLKGANNRNWSATFDWLIKDSNMAKTLDGNYDDRPMQRNDYNAGARKSNNLFLDLLDNDNGDDIL